MELSFSRLLINFCNGLSNGLLLCSLSFSLSVFNRSYSKYLFVFIFILLIFFLVGILIKRIQFNSLIYGLWRIFIGILLGLQIVNFISKENYVNYANVESALLYISLLFYCIYIILYNFSIECKQEFSILLKPEFLEIFGFIVVNIAYQFDISAIIILLAQIISITSINLKSFKAFIFHLLLNMFIIFYFFPKILYLSFNNLFMIAFVFRITFHPAIKLFQNTSSFQRWSVFFNLNKIIRKIFILVIFCIMMCFPTVNTLTIANHKEWFIVVPLFVSLLIVWIIFHFTLIIMCWKLSNKITDYKLNIASNISHENSLQMIMTSNGLRFFSLLAHRICFLCLFSSVLMCLICWETRSAISISLAIAIIPLEIAIKHMFNVLTKQLSGTCAGYAIITPHYIMRDEITLIPLGFNDEINNYGMKLSTKMQSFFHWYMIDIIGCDYLSSGVALNQLKVKVSNFLNNQTQNKIYYDTYLLFYAGPSDDMGNWALMGKEYLNIESILEIWRCSPASHHSRLIIVCENIGPSCKSTLHNYNNIYVAIQTSVSATNVDKVENFRPYSFITNWVDSNMHPDIKLTLNNVTCNSHYYLSPSWPNFQFQSLDNMKIDEISDSFHISQTVSTCISAFDWLLKTLDICNCLMHFIDRIKFRLIPPKLIDTKHGFYIISTN